METAGGVEKPGKLITIHFSDATKGSKDIPLRLNDEGDTVLSPVLEGWANLGFTDIARGTARSSTVVMFTNRQDDYVKAPTVRVLAAAHFIDTKGTDTYYAVPPRIEDSEFAGLPRELKEKDELLEQAVRDNKNGKMFVNIEATDPNKEKILDALISRQLRFMDLVIRQPDKVQKYIEIMPTGK